MFSEQDSTAQLAAHALGMWANYIQTGDVTMSAEDAKRQGFPHPILELKN